MKKIIIINTIFSITIRPPSHFNMTSTQAVIVAADIPISNEPYFEQYAMQQNFSQQDINCILDHNRRRDFSNALNDFGIKSKSWFSSERKTDANGNPVIDIYFQIIPSDKDPISNLINTNDLVYFCVGNFNTQLSISYDETPPLRIPSLEIRKAYNKWLRSNT